MTCKGVYASLGFNIYITKNELLHLLSNSTVIGQAYIGKTQIDDGDVRIYISEATRQALLKAYNQDKAAIIAAKASMDSGYFISVNKVDEL